MEKRSKLKKLLQVFTPDQTSVDFAQLDEQVNKLKEALKEKVQAQTLDDVNRQLEKFRKRLDFAPLSKAIHNLEQSLDLKIEGLSGQLNEETSVLNRLLREAEEGVSAKVSSVALNIKVLEKELALLTKQRDSDLSDLKAQLVELELFNGIAKKTLSDIELSITGIKADKSLESSIKVVKNDVEAFRETIEKLRKEFTQRINNIGGGSINRQIYINNVDALSKYSDINLKPGNNVTITYANNETTKRVDITITATGGAAGGITRSIDSIAVDTNAGSAADTDYVYLVSGTTVLTLPTAVGNNNLYTVKNVGVGVVTIAPTGAETIDGQANIVMPVQYTSVDLISDSLNWSIT